MNATRARTRRNPRESRPVDHSKNLRLVAALVTMLAAAACILASTLTWLALPDGAGHTTFVSGWGAISGGSQIAGQNINDAANGNGSFRPGLLGVIIGGFALLSAIALALPAYGRKPNRIPASVLTLCGLGGLAWGIIRIVAPNSLALPDSSGFTSGAGPWLLAGGSLIFLVTAVVVFLGRLDPPTPIGRRGGRPA
ncbi:hypothetical protein SAMN04515671_3307 [Nakamurella panacisegetis]|uniref:Uncharacterized protein n=1 Tax=Nakamurella panacisegetis TaxID=1090615 RepID=A0A1H0QY89_9ACTN|nr:hypothetical protein [Nakamurella panacisegetis]SDP22170.1 hypothetical protein SAMN04515671_3307 [Nakamurella panacisegetis]